MQDTADFDLSCSNMCYFEGSCLDNKDLFGYVEFFFDGASYWLNPEQYMVEGFHFDLPGYCVFGFLENEASNDTVILGDLFLRYFYTVYDYDAMQVGIGFN